MVVIRPIKADDLEQLVELAEATSFGLTSLPKDHALLAERIADSQRGFDKIDRKPRGETYLFVMEDLDSGKVIGTSGIVSKVGGFEPFYAYRIETAVHESETLGVRKEIRTLHLVTEHNGPCEIGSLFLRPDARKAGRGRLLSLSRFLFMADHPQLFDPVVIAEMRGVIDEHGGSPFWDAVGRHLFDIDFPTADYLSVVNKRFIADLMPKYPIYIPLLPAAAQTVIGKVHENTEPALRMLQSEGFASSGMVDIFEAGPIVSCSRESIRTVSQSVKAVVGEVVAGSAELPESPTYVIGNARRDFRACTGTVALTGDGRVRLAGDVAEALKVKAGDPVRYATLKPA